MRRRDTFVPAHLIVAQHHRCPHLLNIEIDPPGCLVRKLRDGCGIQHVHRGLRLLHSRTGKAAATGVAAFATVSRWWVVEASLSNLKDPNEARDDRERSC